MPIQVRKFDRPAAFLSLLLVLPLVIAPLEAGAQSAPDTEAVSERELQDFAEALPEVQAIQDEMETEISAAIDQSGLSEERFFEIHQQVQQDPGEDPAAGLEEPELKAYRETLTEITDVQNGAQEKMTAAVEATGLEMRRFYQIVMLAREDRALMERLNRYLD